VNVWARFGKFNLVGMMGMAVQLGALAVFNHAWPGHVLACTAAAIELTLLHNFVWHLRITWPDRGDRSATLNQLLRFNLSNGLVSMAGNLALMPLLVRGARIPVVAANAIAVVCLSLVNFCLGNNWAFAAKTQHWQIKCD
jgi:putative flippase GtrA